MIDEQCARMTVDEDYESPRIQEIKKVKNALQNQPMVDRNSPNSKVGQNNLRNGTY